MNVTQMQVTCIKHSRFQRFLVAVLLAHLLAIVAMAASPELHEWMHPDAHDDDHDCAVMLFVGGGAATVAVVVLIVGVMQGGGSQVVPRCDWVEGLFRVLRILEHAPPVAA
jgi:hypothetical protein